MNTSSRFILAASLFCIACPSDDEPGDTSDSAGETSGGSQSSTSAGSSEGSSSSGSGSQSGTQSESGTSESEGGTSETAGSSEAGSSDGASSSGGESGGTMVADCSECGPDEGCVANVAFMTEYWCVPFPEDCDQEFDCACAGELCVDPFTICNDAPDPPQRQISCECPNC